jgi:hypothetical protein
MISVFCNLKGMLMAKFGSLLFLLLLAACAAVPGSLPENVIFHEEFVGGQMADWQLEGDAQGQSSVVNEQLLIDLKESNLMQFVALPSQTFQDFILEVDARQVNGDLSNSYGVLFRMQDPTRFYRFELTGDGKYMFERRNEDGSWTRFVQDWTESPAIEQGFNANNRLRIEAIGPMIAIFVNDTLLQQVTDDGYGSGQIALDAGTFGFPEMQAIFDNVVVSQP